VLVASQIGPLLHILSMARCKSKLSAFNVDIASLRSQLGHVSINFCAIVARELYAADVAAHSSGSEGMPDWNKDWPEHQEIGRD
jgi:hypothetical protein